MLHFCPQPAETPVTDTALCITPQDHSVYRTHCCRFGLGKVLGYLHPEVHCAVLWALCMAEGVLLVSP